MPVDRRAVAGSLIAAVLLAAIVASSASPTAQAAPRLAPLATDLVAFWQFEEVSGNRQDSELGDSINTVLVNQGGLINVTGKFGTAGHCTGGAYMDGPNPVELRTGDIDYTLAAWVKVDSLPGLGAPMTILSKTNAPPFAEYLLRFARYESDYFVDFAVFSGAGATVGLVSHEMTSLVADTWYYVVAWHDAALDEVGVAVNDDFTVEATTGTPGTNTENFNLCRRTNGSDYMPGALDEVGYWERVLSQAEREALYNGGAGCEWPFTDCDNVPTSTATPTQTPLRVSVNYIDQGSFEIPAWVNSAWDTVINDPAIRMMSGASNAPVQGGQDAALWQDLALLGAPQDCGSNAAIILDNSPPEDLRTGRLSQNFDWPGGSMYLSFIGKTTAETKGDVSLLNLGTGMLVPVDPHFSNPSNTWRTARYVHNLEPGRYRLSFSARGTAGQFGFFAFDDVQVRQGWWVNDCEAPDVPGLIPAQQVPTQWTPPPYTPIAPTQWIVWSSPTPLSPEATITPIVYVTHARTPIAPPPDYTPGAQILRNGSFETWIGPPFWLPNNFAYWQSVSRLTRRHWIGGVEGRAYASLDTGVKPPALSQHFEQRAGPQPFHVSLWVHEDSHLVLFIRDAPAGIYRAAWRIDAPPTGGWQQYEFTSPALPVGRYSLEITNVYLQKAHVDEVCLTVGQPCVYPAYYPGIAQDPTAQAEATQYVDFVITMDWSNLMTGNANLTAVAEQQQTVQAIFTSSFLTQQAGGTLSAEQVATGTALAYGATQTAQAQTNSAGATQTAAWIGINQQQTLIAQGFAQQTLTAIAQAQAQTAIALTAQAQFSELQTQVAGTAGAPPALTQTAQSIINTASAPFHATMTAISFQQTQNADATAGTPPGPTATLDPVVATEQALQVPNQPEPYWAASCGRPPNSLNLAWWIDYEVCRVLSWFSWSPVNTAQIQAWQVELAQYEPFGTIQEVIQAGQTVGIILDTYDWNNSGATCGTEAPDPAAILAPASGLLTGQFAFVPGTPIEMNCAIPVRSVLGDMLADGVCGAIFILCQRGLLAWMQYFFDAALIILFLKYVEAAWIEKATAS